MQPNAGITLIATSAAKYLRNVTNPLYLPKNEASRLRSWCLIGESLLQTFNKFPAFCAKRMLPSEADSDINMLAPHAATRY